MGCASLALPCGEVAVSHWPDLSDCSLEMLSAGIGALVGAYVTRQKDGRSLGLVGVNQRILHALEVTRVETFFRFYSTVGEAEAAA